MVQALRKDNKNWCRYGQLIDNAHIVLNSFQQLGVYHVRREANGVVRRLVNNALSFMDEVVHIEKTLQCVNNIVIVECVGQDLFSLII